MSCRDPDTRQTELLTHQVVTGLPPFARAFYLATYSPRQSPRRYYPRTALLARMLSRGVPDPEGVLDALVEAEIALFNPTLDDYCFLHPDESVILTIPW